MKVSDLQVRAYPKCHMKTKWKNYRLAQNKDIAKFKTSTYN